MILNHSMTVIKTERLKIYFFEYCPTEQNAQRLMFVGSPVDEDWPFAVVVASVLESTMFGGSAYLDMIQTNPIQDRRGYAAHMMEALSDHFGGPLVGSGVTDDGEAFVAKMIERGIMAQETLE